MVDVHSRGPNVLITGTPGVGKTTLAREAADRTGLTYINVGELAEREKCFDGFDERFQVPILDEDRVVDELEELVKDGGCVVDYHGCDFFPERWFDAVLVLRTDTKLLYDRLERRSYSQLKIGENVQCEIFGTVLEEARSSYAEDIVREVQSDTPEQMEQNLDAIVEWVFAWCRQRGIELEGIER